MSYKKFNLSRPRKELLKSGEEKTFWDNVGILTIFSKEDGIESGLAEIHLLDKTVKLNVFPFRNSNINNNSNNYSQPAIVDDGSQPEQEEDIDIKNIPF